MGFKAKTKPILCARQGEILIFRIPDEKVKGNRYFETSYMSKGLAKTDNVIREGEKSGHKHEIEGQASLFSFENQPKDEGMVLEVGKEGAEIKHPEHESVKLPEGKYDVKVQREYDEKKHKKAKD